MDAVRCSCLLLLDTIEKNFRSRYRALCVAITSPFALVLSSVRPVHPNLCVRVAPPPRRHARSPSSLRSRLALVRTGKRTKRGHRRASAFTCAPQLLHTVRQHGELALRGAGGGEDATALQHKPPPLSTCSCTGNSRYEPPPPPWSRKPQFSGRTGSLALAVDNNLRWACF